jgi:large subunit ribosomal protein L18
MAKGSRYRVPLRRRRECKTDYQARKAFVVSRKPRFVARSSLKNTVAQIIVAKPHGDEVLASAHSKELVKKYGWKAVTGNIPAAYLTGLLCGLKAKKNGVTEAILDLGLVSPTKGSKVFATLSGVLEAGVVIPYDEKKLVRDRAKGEHIVRYAKSLGAPEEYAPKFSKYVVAEVDPAKLPEHVAKVKNDILTAFGIAVKPEPKVEAKKEAKAEEKVEKKEAKAEGKKAGAKAEGKGEAKKAEAKPAKAAGAKTEAKKPSAKAKGSSKSDAKSGGKKE